MIEKFLSHLGCNRKEAICFFRSSIRKKQAVQFLACRILIEGSRKEIATSRKMDSHDGSAKFPHRDSRLDLRGTPRAIITAGGQSRTGIWSATDRQAGERGLFSVATRKKKKKQRMQTREPANNLGNEISDDEIQRVTYLTWTNIA